jgi:hypothetical protein
MAIPQPDPVTWRRKAGVTDDQVVAAYRRHGSAYPAARELGVGSATVYRVLALRGVPTAGSGRGGNRAYAPGQLRQIAEAYSGGAGIGDLVARFGGSRETVRWSVVRAGVPPRADADAYREARTVERIVRMRLAGDRPAAIAKAVGKSAPAVSEVLRRAGVTEGRDRLAVRCPKCGGKA